MTKPAKIAYRLIFSTKFKRTFFSLIIQPYTMKNIYAKTNLAQSKLNT